jgi:hypothetical protein
MPHPIRWGFFFSVLRVASCAEHVKIGEEHYELLSRHARRIGMPRAEMCRRSIDLYTAITSQLVDIIVALLRLWIEGKIVLAGNPE